MGVLRTIREWLLQPVRLFGNRERGLLEIQALGRQWVLRLNLNHLVGLCEAYSLEDQGMARSLVSLGEKMDTPRGRRTAYVFALRGQDPEITEERAGEIITELGWQQSGNVIFEVLRWAMPEPQKEAAERGKDQAAPSPSPAGATS